MGLGLGLCGYGWGVVLWLELTLTGRNVPITSDVFCVTCGPPGGGGGGTTTDPAILHSDWSAIDSSTCYCPAG